MRTLISTLSVILLITATFSSCSNSGSQGATYECPMKCEGEKTYEKAGTCPVCGMALEEVKKAS